MSAGDRPTVSVWQHISGTQWGKVGEPTTYSELAVEPRHNDAGPWSLSMPANEQALAFAKNRLVTFDMRGLRIDTGFLTNLNPVADERGTVVYSLAGLGGLGILSWLLAYPDPSVAIDAQPYYDPADPAPLNDDAETVVRTLVTGNAARLTHAVAFAASLGRGGTVRARPAFDNLLELVAKKATRGGIGVRLGLVNTSGTRADLTASVYVPVDRSVRVRFAQAIDGSLRKWDANDQAPTATKAIVGGAGSGASRVLIEHTTADSVAAATDWGGHREVFVDGPQSFDDPELQEAGDESLDSGAATSSLRVEAAEADGLLAFTHYNVGDIASASLVTGLDITDTISSIRVAFGASGLDVTPTFGDPDADDPLVSMAQLVRALRGHIKRLQARR